MASMLGEVLIIVLLILLNGLFAMSELAVVSSRKARLKSMVNRGDRKARVALDLANDPNRFLATVQVGITLVGTLAGAVGGASLAEDLAVHLARAPVLAPYAETVALTLVVVGIAYVSLVLGELVPKRLAMSYPERIARATAGLLRFISAIGVPVVRLLSVSTEFVLWVARVRPGAEPPISEEEVNVLLQEGAQAGVFEAAEQEMVKRVFRLGDQRASDLMTPRTEVVWIDIADSPEDVRRKITACPHSQFPVCEQTLDQVLGIVHAKDLLIGASDAQPYNIRGILRVPMFVYEGMRGLKVLELFRTSRTYIAIVLSEYGTVEGLLTSNDILQAIVGDLPDTADDERLGAVQRPDGSWLVDGALNIEKFQDLFEPVALPEGDYRTVAGLVLAQLGRIPAVADAFECNGLGFEVVAMDANRVDQVVVTPRPAVRD